MIGARSVHVEVREQEMTEPSLTHKLYPTSISKALHPLTVSIRKRDRRSGDRNSPGQIPERRFAGRNNQLGTFALQHRLLYYGRT